MELEWMNVQFLVRFKKYGRCIQQIRECCQLISGTYEWLNSKKVAKDKLLNETVKGPSACCDFMEIFQEIQEELEDQNKEIERFSIVMTNIYNYQTQYENLLDCVPNTSFYNKLRNLVIRANSILCESEHENTLVTPMVGSTTQSFGSSLPEIALIREKDPIASHPSRRKRSLGLNTDFKYVNHAQRFHPNELKTDEAYDMEFSSRFDKDMELIQARKAVKRSESETEEIEAQCNFNNNQSIIEISSDDEV